MKKIIVLLSCIVPFISFAQKASKHASQYFLQLGGIGGFYTLNYDARILKSEKGLGFRISAGVYPNGIIGQGTYGTISIPLGLNYLIGKNGNYFEAGTSGRMHVFSSDDVYSIGFEEYSQTFFTYGSTILGSIYIGSRHQPVTKRDIT